MYRRWRYTVVAAGIITPLLGLSLQSAHGAGPPRAQIAARSLAVNSAPTPQPNPLRLPDSALEPIDWNALDGWQADDHAAAFATFLASCRPLLHTSLQEGEKRPMYLALTHACRQAVAAGRLAEEQARIFFERNFRPLRISKLGDSAGPYPVTTADRRWLAVSLVSSKSQSTAAPDLVPSETVPALAFPTGTVVTADAPEHWCHITIAAKY
jgi:hypothetical protein